MAKGKYSETESDSTRAKVRMLAAKIKHLVERLDEMARVESATGRPVQVGHHDDLLLQPEEMRAVDEQVESLARDALNLRVIPASMWRPPHAWTMKQLYDRAITQQDVPNVVRRELNATLRFLRSLVGEAEPRESENAGLCQNAPVVVSEAGLLRDVVVIVFAVVAVSSGVLNVGLVANVDPRAAILFGAVGSAFTVVATLVTPGGKDRSKFDELIRTIHWARASMRGTTAFAIGAAIFTTAAWAFGCYSVRDYQFSCAHEQAVTWQVLGIWGGARDKCADNDSGLSSIWHPRRRGLEDSFECVYRGARAAPESIRNQLVQCPEFCGAQKRPWGGEGGSSDKGPLTCNSGEVITGVVGTTMDGVVTALELKCASLTHEGSRLLHGAARSGPWRGSKPSPAVPGEPDYVKHWEALCAERDQAVSGIKVAYGPYRGGTFVSGIAVRCGSLEQPHSSEADRSFTGFLPSQAQGACGCGRGQYLAELGGKSGDWIDSVSATCGSVERR